MRVDKRTDVDKILAKAKLQAVKEDVHEALRVPMEKHYGKNVIIMYASMWIRADDKDKTTMFLELKYIENDDPSLEL